MTLDGPMDAENFRAWTEPFLAPVLKPNDIVVMDHLPAQKVTGMRQAIAAQGANPVCRKFNFNFVSCQACPGICAALPATEHPKLVWIFDHFASKTNAGRLMG
jgi:hypothetical protein